jgi:hypothetical protein
MYARSVFALFSSIFDSGADLFVLFLHYQSKKGGLYQQQTHHYDQDEDDGELVQDIYDQIRRSGTINVFDWSRDEIDAAIRESNYQLDDTVTALLDLKAMSGGQVTKMTKAVPKASNNSKAKHDDEEYYDDDGEYYDDQGTVF